MRPHLFLENISWLLALIYMLFLIENTSMFSNNIPIQLKGIVKAQLQDSFITYDIKFYFLLLSTGYTCEVKYLFNICQAY